MSRNALFCSASEWPLFFGVFSFFPQLIFSTGTALKSCFTVSTLPGSRRWALRGGIGCLRRLLSLGVRCCPTALRWLQQRFPLSVELTADGSVRVRQPLCSGLHTQLALPVRKANRWMWVDMSGKASCTVKYAYRYTFDLIISSWSCCWCYSSSFDSESLASVSL